MTVSRLYVIFVFILSLVPSLHSQGNDPEAIILQFKQAIMQDQTDPQNHYQLCLYIRKLYQFQRALKHCEKALDLNWNNAEYHNLYGFLLGRLERYDEAEKEFKIAISQDDQEYIFYYNYGYVLGKLHKYEDAQKIYRKCLTFTQDAYIYQAYGLVLQEVNRYKEAQFMLRKAKQLDPTNGFNFLYHAQVLRLLNRYDEAESILQNLIQRDQITPIYYVRFGFLLDQMGKTQQAQKIFLIAIDKWRNPEALFYYSILLTKEGKFQEAEKFMNESVTRNTKNPEAFEEYSNLLFLLGKVKEGKQMLKKAALAFMEAGIQLGKLSSYTNYNEKFTKAISLDGSNYVIFLNYGKVLIKYGKIKNAENILQKAEELRSENPYIISTLLSFYFVQNNQNKTFEYLDKLNEIVNEEDCLCFIIEELSDEQIKEVLEVVKFFQPLHKARQNTRRSTLLSQQQLATLEGNLFKSFYKSKTGK